MKLVMKNGKKYTVTGETDKYYLCKNTQFRKNNPMIAKVEEDEPIHPLPFEAEAPEIEAEEKPKKKKAKKEEE